MPMILKLTSSMRSKFYNSIEHPPPFPSLFKDFPTKKGEAVSLVFIGIMKHKERNGGGIKFLLPKSIRPPCGLQILDKAL